MKTLREYINILDNTQLDEGWWSNVRSKINDMGQRTDFEMADRHIDWLISKAQTNQINGLDAITRLGWYNIMEAVAQTKDSNLNRLLDDISESLRHWPEKNTDATLTRNLISQLDALKQGLSTYYQNIFAQS